MDGFVVLRINGDGLNLQEITDQLGYSPDFSYRKGDVYVDKIIKGRTIIYDEDCWLADIRKTENETLEECIEKFVLKFNHAACYLKTLASKFNVTVWITAYPEDEQLNIHLSEKTIFALSEMGASLDCNVLFLKEFYDGSYLDKQKEAAQF